MKTITIIWLVCMLVALVGGWLLHRKGKLYRDAREFEE